VSNLSDIDTRSFGMKDASDRPMPAAKTKPPVSENLNPSRRIDIERRMREKTPMVNIKDGEEPPE
jgi:hypothetical protein